MTYFWNTDEWLTDFFGIEFACVDLDDLTSDISPEDLVESGVLNLPPVGIQQIAIRFDQIKLAPILERAGFTLVDGQFEFIAEVKTPVQFQQPPVGFIRLVKNTDISRIEEITWACFTNNEQFHGRFNNRQWFTKGASQRYYMQWNLRAIEQFPQLFAVWENEVVDSFVNLFNHDRRGTTYLKVGLAAALPGLEIRGLQNLQQKFLYSMLPSGEYRTINAPAISNPAGLKLNLAANRSLLSSKMIFFRVRDDFEPV